MGVAVPIEGVKILRGCLAGPRLLSAWQAQYSELLEKVMSSWHGGLGGCCV